MLRLARVLIAVGTVVLVAAGLSIIGPTPAGSAPDTPPLVISEVRWHGAGGELDDYVELLSLADAPVTVQAGDGSAGYAIALANDTVFCTVPNGTVIPAHGHFLCMGLSPSTVYGYPAASGEVVGYGDVASTVDLPDGVGVALFGTSDADGFVAGNRIDAVGPATETDAVYREGNGLPALPPEAFSAAWVRHLDVALLGTAVDTGDNAVDFVAVDPAAATDDTQRRLGAPGPERLSSPTSNAGIAVSLIDPCLARDDEPNLVRDTTADPPHDAPAGTVEVRRVLTNHTGGAVTRLRLRVAEIQNLPGPTTADLRVSSVDFDLVAVDGEPCGDGPQAINAHGTALETPPAQDLGGGVNSTLSVEDVSPAQPLADGASIAVRIMLDVEVAGRGGLIVVPEVTTDGPAAVSAHPGACLATTTTDEGAPDMCLHSVVTASEAYTTTQDQALTVAAPGVLANDRDPDQDVITATLAAAPEHGELTLASDGGFTFIPAPGFVGADSFVYGTDGSAEVVAIVVEPAPTTTTEAPTTTAEPTTTTRPEPATAVDPGGTALPLVAAETEESTRTSLPQTGTDPRPLLSLGAALLAAGGVIRSAGHVARRRAAAGGR